MGGSEAADRTALVTGGSRGIGRAIVEALLGEGWRVFFCSRSEESVERALSELAKRHPERLSGRAADVGDPDAADSLVRWAVGETGRLDLLVNNAGVGGFGAVDELAPDDWRRTIDTNLSGAFYLMRAAAPEMKRRGGGWIVNIASLAARHPFAGGAAYNASKFGLLGLSDAAMLDLRGDGIRVAAVLPGSVATDFGRGGDGDESWKLTPADVAAAVLDLLRYPDRALPSRIELRPTRTSAG